MTAIPSPERGSLAALNRFARPRPAVERCELCSLALLPEHPHLLELTTRRITCSCDACAVLFTGQEGARFRRIPRQGQLLAGFELPDVLWDHLHIPIKLAFLFHNSAADRAVALYPSPAGAVEALLPQETWPELLARNPVLSEFEPDVEALLVNRVGERRDCYRAPIDECFRLVGLIRTHWRGLSGGSEVWEVIERFFARVRGGRS
ncbi:MAG: DUF5947 family protein [Gemmataceae bacterium]|nr:DUF5947 family protein [Gemmataceae bacterium]